MTAFFLSSLGYTQKANGQKIPVSLPHFNGFSERLHAFWPDHARVLLIASAPDRHDYTDSVLSGLRESFRLSHLPFDCFDFCDFRDESALEHLAEYHVIILPGGHVPTQNAYHQRIALRTRLEGYSGLLIAWSAGAMNCANTVYALPEQEGEAVDPAYNRFLPGLGLTQHTIIPHFAAVSLDVVDGLRAIEDMALPDSLGREFLGLYDGSYLLSHKDTVTLFGEACLLKDGELTPLQPHGESRIL